MQLRVLLADDHKVVLEGVRSLVSHLEGTEVVGEATNGREAVALCRKLRPDIVIMDIAMPNMNGIDATREILSDDHKPRVIALSMHPEWSYVANMLEAGAYGYLLKDCAIDEIQKAIKAVSEDRVYISEAIKRRDQS